MFVAIGLLDHVVYSPDDAYVCERAELHIELIRFVLFDCVEKADEPFLQ